jgi:predicted dehydrogenase
MPDPTLRPVSRRAFLSTGATVATGVLTGLPAAAWARVPGANDRIRLGVIGSGGRARDVMRHLMAQPNVEVVALADVWETSLDRAQQMITTGTPRRFRDHRALLEDDSIDAVLIGTPDHWHAPATIDSVRAGKDVYVE